MRNPFLNDTKFWPQVTPSSQGGALPGPGVPRTYSGGAYGVRQSMVPGRTPDAFASSGPGFTDQTVTNFGSGGTTQNLASVASPPTQSRVRNSTPDTGFVPYGQPGNIAPTAGLPRRQGSNPYGDAQVFYSDPNTNVGAMFSRLNSLRRRGALEAVQRGYSPEMALRYLSQPSPMPRFSPRTDADGAIRTLYNEIPGVRLGYSQQPTAMREPLIRRIHRRDAALGLANAFQNPQANVADIAQRYGQGAANAYLQQTPAVTGALAALQGPTYGNR